ncbi:MAG: carboxymuconolactone decarboxylase family protein, partial [Planctomycetaceae bacterium]|nr:carboxymuconolactone decarboxylase family protein [Planctomycetaceae bacterium]
MASLKLLPEVKMLSVIVVIMFIVAGIAGAQQNSANQNQNQNDQKGKNLVSENSQKTDTVKKQTAGRSILGEFAPKFAELNDDVLFGEVWSREQELSAKHRSMITVSALISGGNFEQLVPHLKKAKENGITKTEIAEIITHLAFYTGWPKAWSAFNIAKEIYNDGNDLSAKIETSSANYVRLAKIRVD